MNGIQLKEVTKQYGELKALDAVSLVLEPDTIYGLLGRNGAGKTTLLNGITGRIFTDQGTILMDGQPVVENDEMLGRIYLTSEQDLFPEGMRLKEAIRWTAAFYPEFDVERAHKLAQTFSLSERKKFSKLSTGYKTIFKLVLALSTNAEYLFLDEPVLGLDANHRDVFYKNLLEQYAEKPFCAVLSTHLVEEVSGFLEQVLVIREGQLVCNQSRDSLLAGSYVISGVSGAVDVFAQGKTVLGEESLGNLKSVYLQGERPEVLPEGLECSGMELQKLFIQMTN